MLYNSILIPIDLSHPERAEAMFEKARALLAEGGKMSVLHVIPDIPGYVVAELPGSYLESASQRARKELTELLSELQVEVAPTILVGQAADTILAVADKNECDLILVGSHRPGLSDYLLGSTAARVVRHAKCSVLVLR